MPLTRSFKDTVKSRADRDPAFRGHLLAEGVDALLAADMQGGKAVLRACINATIGFDGMAEQTGLPAKSLMRMLGPRGNPNASNMFAIIHSLQRSSGTTLTVHFRSVSVPDSERPVGAASAASGVKHTKAVMRAHKKPKISVT